MQHLQRRRWDRPRNIGPWGRIPKRSGQRGWDSLCSTLSYSCWRKWLRTTTPGEETGSWFFSTRLWIFITSARLCWKNFSPSLQNSKPSPKPSRRRAHVTTSTRRTGAKTLSKLMRPPRTNSRPHLHKRARRAAGQGQREDLEAARGSPCHNCEPAKDLPVQGTHNQSTISNYAPT